MSCIRTFITTSLLYRSIAGLSTNMTFFSLSHARSSYFQSRTFISIFMIKFRALYLMKNISEEINADSRNEAKTISRATTFYESSNSEINVRD